MRRPVTQQNPNRTLTQREQALVEIYAQAAADGRDITRTDAGRLAGYSGTTESSRIQASRALARPAVRNALMERIKELAQADVPFAYGVIRHVAAKATSTRDKLGAASKLLDVAGMTGGTGAQSGPGVAIQIVFQTQAGAVLAQPAGAVIEGQANQGIGAPAHSLAEGGRGRKPRRKTPSPGPTQDARAAPGVKNRARRLAAGSPSRRSVSEVVGDFVGGVGGDE
jgi:hypothetical protein